VQEEIWNWRRFCREENCFVLISPAWHFLQTRQPMKWSASVIFCRWRGMRCFEKQTHDTWYDIWGHKGIKCYVN
jgi:hypothetical protein